MNAEQPGDPEIRELDLPVLGQQEVGRLDVAVDDPPIVGMSQRPAGLDADLGDLPPREHPAPPQLLFQAAPVDQLHGVEQDPILFAEAEELHDVGVVELPQGLDLDREALAKIGLVGQRGRQDFDRRRLVGLDVHAFVDRPHAAASQRPTHAIRPKLLRFHRPPPLDSNPIHSIVAGRRRRNHGVARRMAAEALMGGEVGILGRWQEIAN